MEWSPSGRVICRPSSSARQHFIQSALRDLDLLTAFDADGQVAQAEQPRADGDEDETHVHILNLNEKTDHLNLISNVIQISV